MELALKMEQLGLFEAPKAEAPDQGAFVLFMVNHLHGYTAQNPSRCWRGTYATEAEAKRRGRKKRRDWVGWPWFEVCPIEKAPD